MYCIKFGVHPSSRVKQERRTKPISQSEIFLRVGICLAGEFPAPEKTVEILGSVALLWILALAKARSAVPISTAILAKRAIPQSGTKIDATVDGARARRLQRSFGDGPALGPSFMRCLLEECWLRRVKSLKR